MFRASATAFRLIAALAWDPFGWRFGGSGEATEWAKEEENGVGKDFSVDFSLEVDLVLTRPLLGVPLRGPPRAGLDHR